jgi:hypothetical protein
MRTRAWLAVALLLLAPDAAQAQRRATPRLSANPSALIAAEIGFARLAHDKGQWTAFVETAADNAEMFVPKRVVAKEWLKKRANPPVALKWQAHDAWTSCDGATGVTRGAWQGPDSTNGYFTTVWQRQKKGDFKWVLDQGDALAMPLTAPEFLEGKVADCPRRARMEDGPPPGPPPGRKPDKNAPVPLRPLAGPIPPLTAPAGADARDGRSDDGTLAWRSVVMTDGAREFTVWFWKDGAMQQIVHSVVAAPPGKG